MRGFLTGFVDALCVQDGRWFVVDWKSNHLGDRVEDYGPEALWSSMTEHHYVLQYHLYVLALHRHLAARLADYDYDRDFGGVAYVFLRGLGGPGDLGVYEDRPPRPLVEALDALVAGREDA